MATVYKFEVSCVSAFCAFEEEYIKKYIENALKEFKENDLKLESIEVKLKEQDLNENRFIMFNHVFKHNEYILKSPLCWHVWKVAWNILKAKKEN